MTDEQAIAKLEDLIGYIESLKRVTRLRVNGLISSNKTEREYYEYREKKEWLRTSNLQLNGLKAKKREEQDFIESVPADSMAAYASKCIIKYYNMAINALKKEEKE